MQAMAKRARGPADVASPAVSVFTQLSPRETRSFGLVRTD